MDHTLRHKTVIEQLKDNQEAALKILFDTYADDIFGVAFSVLKDSQESEDLVQEVFIRLWNTRSTLDENGNIWSLLYVMTKRMSLNRWRDRKRLPECQILSANIIHLKSDNPDNNVYADEINNLENEAVNMLPEQQKKAYLLSRAEGLTHKEIAQLMDVSPHTVKNHIVQALKTLKKHFQKFGYPLLLIFFQF
ncbi:MAG TPA: RNA polymerase sigma-70 factor [Sphingobacterium sp.]|nr:RNA polymerase sigma-70 factor [Sphingobacterium sp.]